MTGRRPRLVTETPATVPPTVLPADESREFIRDRLVAGLRDAHAATLLRQELFRRIGEASTEATLCQLARQSQAEAEEHQRRLEHIFATLRECPSGGHATAMPAMSNGARMVARDGALADLARRTIRRDVLDVKALQLMANAAGQHLAARLLGETAQELCAAAEALANLPRLMRDPVLH